MDDARCFSCDDHGHLTTEHCWFEGDKCTCGDKSIWGGVRQCDLDGQRARTEEG